VKEEEGENQKGGGAKGATGTSEWLLLAALLSLFYPL